MYWAKTTFATVTLSVVLSSQFATAGANRGNSYAAKQDPTAVALMQTSINGLGGSAAVSAIQDCTIKGTIQPLSGTVKTLVWIFAGTEFREELDDVKTTNVFVSGHGKPARSLNGVVAPINYHAARAKPAFYVPAFVLLQELSTSGYTISYVGPTTVAGHPAVQIHVSDDSDAAGSMVTPHDWYFDATSFLPLQVDFRVPSNQNAADYVNASFDFSQFSPTEGVSTPFTVTYSEEGVALATITVNSVLFNTGVPSSTFDLP